VETKGTQFGEFGIYGPQFGNILSELIPCVNSSQWENVEWNSIHAHAVQSGNPVQVTREFMEWKETWGATEGRGEYFQGVSDKGKVVLCALCILTLGLQNGSVSLRFYREFCVELSFPSHVSDVDELMEWFPTCMSSLLSIGTEEFFTLY